MKSTSTLARRALLLLLPTFLAACQGYAPAPLDLEAHHARLAARDPFDGDVTAYAERLAAPGTPPARFDPSDGLSLPEAEVVALFFNPDARIARLKVEGAQAGAASAGRWEDPEFAIDAARILEGVDDPWVLGGMLNLTIPLSGGLGVERERAAAEASAEALRALAEERRVLAELRTAWAEWSATVERASLTRGLLDELEPMVDRAERLRAAGELGPLDARLLRIERASQQAKLRAYEADVRAAEVQLKAHMGLLPTADVKLVPALAEPREPPSADGVFAAVAEHPRVRLARSEYEVAERTLKLEVRKQFPDLQLGGGYGTDEGDQRILFGAALPLPLFNGNRRAIAEARAGRDVARATAEAEYQRLLAEASVALAQYAAVRERLGYVEEELAPLADQQVADALRLAQLGDLDTLVLLEALKAAHEAKLDILDARLSLALVSRRLESLQEGGSPAAARGAKEIP